MTFTLRKATLADAAPIERLIGESVRGLSRDYYTSAQIDAALGTAFGLDRTLITDGTYFVAEAGAAVAEGPAALDDVLLTPARSSAVSRRSAPGVAR